MSTTTGAAGEGRQRISLLRVLGPAHVWALGVGIVLVGEFMGWNFSVGKGGAIGFAEDGAADARPRRAVVALAAARRDRAPRGWSAGFFPMFDDAGESGGQKPDGRQHAEASAHGSRHGQHGNALLVAEAAEHTLLRIGREDEMTAVAVVVESGTKAFAHDHELRHRLRRRTRLADDVVERGARIEAIEQRYTLPA